MFSSRAAGGLPSRGRGHLLAAALLIASACASEPERPGTELMAPEEFSEVTGTYSASRLIVEHSGVFVDLIGDPDTRLDLQLNADGSAHGQLKIGADRQLRTKQELVGTWRLRIPNRVTFDFAAETFVDQISFEIVSDGLAGDWLGEDVYVRVELRRVR